MTARRLSGILPFPGDTSPLETLPASRGNLASWLRFTLAPGVFEGWQRALLQAFGTPDNALGAGKRSAECVVPEHVAAGLVRGPSAAVLDGALRWLDQPGHHLVTVTDAQYPRLLRHIADPPTVLYVAGRLDLLQAPCFAVVGSRNATPQGLRDAHDFSFALSEAGFTIVSGLALGIDAAAHRGGLAGGASSIAVLGTGADRIYPRRNAALARELAETGAIVSEFPLGTSPLPQNFPRRNRVISGLSYGVLVVEAALASGSLITAHEAAEQGRDVFAIPGSIHSPFSQGCHKLLKDGATLTACVGDIFEELRINLTAPNAVSPARPACTQSQRVVLDAMGYGPVTIDALSAACGRDVIEVSALLSELEIAGHVSGVAGGLFQRMA